MSRSALETRRILTGIRKSEGTWDRDRALQRSEASSRKLTLFAMGNWNKSWNRIDMAQYRYVRFKIVIACADSRDGPRRNGCAAP
jgi:hypothetical protein